MAFWLFLPFTTALGFDTDAAIEAALARKLQSDPYWHLLLHYRPTVFGGVRSEADGLEFFASLQGRTNPISELKETLRAFASHNVPQREELHPQCKWPARYAFLDEQLDLSRYGYLSHPCERLNTWIKALDTEAVSLVFAGFYINNPATMFGHTFLRLHQKDPSRPKLLDYTVSYAANTGDIGGPLYAIYGLFGVYPGTFSTYPYYLKVQQYNNKDRRDLWEYPLTLSPSEIHQMLLHLWELGSTYFRYYFVDENCSYHLFQLLEIAQPNRKLLDKLPIFVTPSDTVKIAFNADGLSKEPHGRPSVLSRFLFRSKALSKEEKNWVSRLAFGSDEDLQSFMQSEIQADTKARILDAGIDRLGVENESGHLNEKEKSLRLARSQIPVITKDETSPSSTPPHLGHASQRIGLSGGGSNAGSFLDLNFRYAFHDLLASPEGYPENAAVEVGRFSFRYWERNQKFRLQDATLIHILSIYPISTFFKKPSWTTGFGFTSLRNESCFDCLSSYLEVGTGFSIPTSRSRASTLYLLGHGFFQAAPWNQTGYRLGPKAKGGWLFHISKEFRILGESEIDYSPIGKPNWSYDAKIHFAFSLMKDAEVRAVGRKFRSGEEFQLALFRYF